MIHTAYVCPIHGIISEREMEEAVQHREDPTHADDDGYREIYYCPIHVRAGDLRHQKLYEQCLQRLEEKTLAEG